MLSLSGRPVGLGNTQWLAPANSNASRRIDTARSDNGTRCALPAFMRSPGTVQTALSRSISSQVASRTSPDRIAVSVRNSNASFVVGHASVACILRNASPTSA